MVLTNAAGGINPVYGKGALVVHDAITSTCKGRIRWSGRTTIGWACGIRT